MASDETIDEASALKNLTEDVRDQDDVERDITYHANLKLIEVEDQKDERRIEKAEAAIKKLEATKKKKADDYRRSTGRPLMKISLEKEIEEIDSNIEISLKDIADFRARIEQRHRGGDAEEVQGGTKKLPNESRRDFLIRTGKITPFAKFGGPRPEGVDGELADALIGAEDEATAAQLEEQAGHEPRSHQNLRAPGFDQNIDANAAAAESEFGLRPRKKRRVQRDDASSDEFTPHPSDPVEADLIDEQESEEDRPRKRGKKPADDEIKEDLSKIDDGNETSYQERLADWVARRSEARHRRRQEEGEQGSDDAEEKEWFKPSPDHPDHDLGNGLKLPGDIYPALFDYQKTGVQWLAELYQTNVGGIVGDEMGLGKTIQLISFVAALHYSKQLNKPVVVVAPATVLKQWVSEFHRWWPALRVSILHSSGSGMLNLSNEGRIEEKAEKSKGAGTGKKNRAATKIVDRVVKHGHVLVTTYAGLQTYGDLLTPIDWGYAVLDEGHKIRNPNSAVTMYCKELRTPNRVILSGTPMQNNLVELWSLFDFIYPMRLGTLVDFRYEFEIPIKQGGHANASNLQIMTAEKRAEVLKDTISPYLLQRLKADVAADLPKKTEQVLFCKLSVIQRDSYQTFLASSEMEAILKGTRNALYGIDMLRKICNHPDLLEPKWRLLKDYVWGKPSKSGKMQVVKALLPMWKRLGHKTLLFSQGVQMLDLLEGFVKSLKNIKYLRMDGRTAVKDRQALVDQFNDSPDIDLFLLTTKVGGLGVNLTGANRVIIFDPDWNPSTDVQARERAWRLGQKKEVTIYRLMTAGTIEEKIFHRQIFKQYLSNKVLKDPKQRTNLHLHDIHDLFTLGSSEDKVTETGKLFEGSEVKLANSSTAKSTEATGVTGTQDEPVGHHNEPDLGTLDGVAGLQDYEPEPANPSSSEDRIMQGLLASSGVHSALEHDSIVNGRKPTGANPLSLRRDVDDAAKQATAALRRAEEQARSVPIGTVTWTGERGEAGRPPNIRRGRGGPSSANVLSGLANRQGLATPKKANGTTQDTPGSDSKLQKRDFARMIPQFMRTHGGRVPTKMLVDHFNQFKLGRDQLDDLTSALMDVADKQTGGSTLKSIWVLKPRFNQ
ncbi:SNF2 family N-terminal domain-containing protein [Hypoxylon fuscum]|nr:SNF2 family N-terminal domain-containing protein [Hypoxylon fuscum]